MRNRLARLVGLLAAVPIVLVGSLVAPIIAAVKP